MTEGPIRAARIAADIETLAGLTEPGRPWTRRAFTPMFDAGRAELTRLFRAAGLATRVDAAGNLIGRRPGRRPGAGTLMLGSHSDTVPDGGRFDGVAGVVVALEVARALSDAGVTLDHDFEIVDFLAEEVSIFGVSCIGSRGMAGVLPADWLTRRADGRTLADALAAVGGYPAGNACRPDIAAFLELHIEQGPVLETSGDAVGIVRAIAGIARFEIRAEGRPDHAGTTPMGARQDALAAAARVILGVERLATDRAAGPAHFAATVGECDVAPNAANVVPGNVRLLIDARAEIADDMEGFAEDLDELVATVTAATGVALTCRRISDNPAAPLDTRVRATLSDAAAALGLAARPMVSGAGHDAAFLSRVARAGMVFVPCRGGRSHCPEEWAYTDALAAGGAVLYEAVMRLDRQNRETGHGPHSG